jgi:diaminopimelate decarboxylase
MLLRTPSTMTEPAGAPWPASARFDRDGLSVGGVSAGELARRFGTPLLVVDEADLRARCRAAAASFPRALYAVKAFTAHAVIHIALAEGLDLLAASGGEVEACLRAGAPASRIVLHGNNKSDDELALAVACGLSLVVADGREELERLDAVARAAGRVQPVLLRVVPEIAVETHEAIATGHEQSKFGTPLADSVEVVRSCLQLPGVRFEGLHAHVGSQVQSVDPYLAEVDVLVDLAVRLRDEVGAAVAVVDVGGGFAVTYEGERSLGPDAAAAAARARLEARCAETGLAMPVLMGEPGRALVATPALTLYRVGAMKRAGGRSLVAVDGGMSDNIRPLLYDTRHTVAFASPPRDGGAADRVTVVGRHCESGDVLAEGVDLPADLRRDDLVAFAATGAYTYPLASSYNRVGRLAVVAVRDGRAVPWLRREDPGDMDRFETGLDRVAPPDPAIPEGVTIRPARASDDRAFMTFWRAIVEEGRFVRSERVSHPLRVYRRRFSRARPSQEAHVMAVEGDRVVGYLSIQRESHPVSEHVASLALAVAADRRGRGIGSALMSEALRWARGAGVQRIVLSVYPHNTAAIALYRRYGFVEEGRLSRQSRKSYGYEDEILMGAWIGPVPEESDG